MKQAATTPPDCPLAPAAGSSVAASSTASAAPTAGGNHSSSMLPPRVASGNPTPPVTHTTTRSHSASALAAPNQTMRSSLRAPSANSPGTGWTTTSVSTNSSFTTPTSSGPADLPQSMEVSSSFPISARCIDDFYATDTNFDPSALHRSKKKAAAAATTTDSTAEDDDGNGPILRQGYLMRGRYSVVRRVVCRKTSQEYAAKMVRTNGEGFNPEEAELLRQLDHPHVIGLVDVFRTRDSLTMVTPFASGGELFQRASTPVAPLSEADAARYTFQLLDALAYLHANGIVHRDIKLENVMLTGSSAVLLIDFGFSKRIGVGQRTLSSCCGSPHYMSPEMLKASRNSVAGGLPSKNKFYGAEVDIWAAGVALYVLLFGEYPFDDERHSQWHKKILGGQYQIPHWRRESTSPEALSLLRRLLDVNVACRATAADALSHEWFVSHGLFAKRDSFYQSAAPLPATATARTDGAVRKKTPPSPTTTAPGTSSSGSGSALRSATASSSSSSSSVPIPTAVLGSTADSLVSPAAISPSSPATAAGSSGLVSFTPPRNLHRLSTGESPNHQ